MIKCFKSAARIAALVLATAALPGRSAETTPGEKPLRTALYAEDGCRGSGALFWAQMLANAPELELELVDGADIRAGKLDNVALLVVPGGASGRQYEMLGDAGAEALRRFVAGGGAYVGTCAGLHQTLNRNKRCKLLAFTLRPNSAGSEAPLAVDFTPAGAEKLGIAPGRRVVRYSHGPIVDPAPQPGEGKSEVVATYASSITRIGGNSKSFFGSPAAIVGEYGKGRVAVTGFHPESYASTRDIALGLIYAATGVAPKPRFPAKSFRPIRVGYFSPTIRGKRCFAEFVALDRDPEIDLRPTDTRDLDSGALEHLDVMIFADGNAARYRSTITPKRSESIVEFLRRGGTVIVTGNAADFLPEHPGRVTFPPETPLAEAVRSACRAPSRNPPAAMRP